VVDAVVVTTNSSPRSLPVDELVPVALDVFGEDRVFEATPLPEAIDVGLALAERETSFGGFGVIVTGSVVTAGDARRAFGARP
ncbi:MAG: dihydrofolate synthase, partial [Jiangellaceae bacterium]